MILNTVSMKNINITVILMAVITIVSFGQIEGNMKSLPSVRNKRSNLIFPPASVLQLTVGVTAVIDLLGNPSGQLSYGFQQNIALPTKFTGISLPSNVKIKRSLDVFSELQKKFSRFTINGTECLKQIICQVSEKPFKGGLLEELLNFVFTPSNHEDLLGQGNDNHPFLIWESIGRSPRNCHSTFPLCKSNPVDIIFDLVRTFL